MKKKIIPYSDGTFTEYSTAGYNILSDQVKNRVIEVNSEEPLPEKEGHDVISYYVETENIIRHKYVERPLTLEEQSADKEKAIRLLKEQQLRTDDDLASFMDFILMGGI